MRQSRFSLASARVARETRPADTHVIELGFLGAQTGLDIAQALAIGELGESHAQVLIETGKALHLVMAAVALDTAPEAMKGKVVDQLCENDSARVHKPSPRLKPREHGGPSQRKSSR